MKVPIKQGLINSLRHLILSNLKYDPNHNKIVISDDSVIQLINKCLTKLPVTGVELIKEINKEV
jgi:hypothetical protein